MTAPEAKNPASDTARAGGQATVRSHAERRARRQWYPFPSVAIDRIVEAGLVKRSRGKSVWIVTTRALPDRLLVMRTDAVRGLIAQPARPSGEYRSPDYIALAATFQIRLGHRLQKLARDGDIDRFVGYLVEVAKKLGAEDQKVVEAEMLAHGGKLPEKREPRVSVRALRGGLPGLGKRS